ncbi:unnamed protein product, partial [Ilex paraguariensis]
MAQTAAFDFLFENLKLLLACKANEFQDHKQQIEYLYKDQKILWILVKELVEKRSEHNEVKILVTKLVDVADKAANLVKLILDEIDDTEQMLFSDLDEIDDTEQKVISVIEDLKIINTMAREICTKVYGIGVQQLHECGGCSSSSRAGSGTLVVEDETVVVFSQFGKSSEIGSLAIKDTEEAMVVGFDRGAARMVDRLTGRQKKLDFGWKVPMIVWLSERIGTERQKHLEELGFDLVAARKVLTGGQKQLEVVSIVGMRGSGKTTLARKVYNDPCIASHFNVGAFISVPKHGDLSLGVLDSYLFITDQIRKMNHEELCKELYTFLEGQRYLVVVDDIMDICVWNHLRICFPDDNNGSKIILTKQQERMAFKASPLTPQLLLPLLTLDESWVLLEKKVFGKESCPQELWKFGSKIAEKCHGLPLTIVVIAGLLAKEEKTQYFWEHVAQSVVSYVAAVLIFAFKFHPDLELAYINIIEDSLGLGYISDDIKMTIKKEVMKHYTKKMKQYTKKMCISIPQDERSTCGSSLIARTPNELKIMASGNSSIQRILNTEQTGRRSPPTAGIPNVDKEIVVGFDQEAETIKERLIGQKKLEVVTIVGMAGLGKTTLARKVYNDPFIVYHFYIRGWAYVSQV